MIELPSEREFQRANYRQNIKDDIKVNQVEEEELFIATYSDIDYEPWIEDAKRRALKYKKDLRKKFYVLRPLYEEDKSPQFVE